MAKKETQKSKRERFERLANHRTNQVLKRLRILSNCANRNLYKYDKKDIDKIFSEIKKEVKKTESEFFFPSEEEKKFKL